MLKILDRALSASGAVFIRRARGKEARYELFFARSRSRFA